MSSKDRNRPSRQIRRNLSIRWAGARPVLYRATMAIGDLNANERDLLQKLWAYATSDEPTERPWLRHESLFQS